MPSIVSFSEEKKISPQFGAVVCQSFSLHYWTKNKNAMKLRFLSVFYSFARMHFLVNYLSPKCKEAQVHFIH